MLPTLSPAVLLLIGLRRPRLIAVITLYLPYNRLTCSAPSWLVFPRPNSERRFLAPWNTGVEEALTPCPWPYLALIDYSSTSLSSFTRDCNSEKNVHPIFRELYVFLTVNWSTNILIAHCQSKLQMLMQSSDHLTESSLKFIASISTSSQRASQLQMWSLQTRKYHCPRLQRFWNFYSNTAIQDADLAWNLFHSQLSRAWLSQWRSIRFTLPWNLAKRGWSACILMKRCSYY